MPHTHTHTHTEREREKISKIPKQTNKIKISKGEKKKNNATTVRELHPKNTMDLLKHTI